MMWDGVSPRNWMMYSPRSVSTGSIPAASRAWLRPISSAIIDLPLVTLFAPIDLHRSMMIVARLLGVLRVVHLAAALAHLALVGLEIEVEMGERVILDRARAVAQRLEFGQPRDRGRAPADEIAREGRVRPAGARRSAPRATFSLKCAEVATSLIGARSVWLSPIAGPSAMPARISATWRALTAEPSRCSLPAMFKRQPRSPASTVSALAPRMSSAFRETIAFESSPYLVANRPPKPQQVSASSSSTSVRPSTPASSRRGCALTPSSRRPAQES